MDEELKELLQLMYIHKMDNPDKYLGLRDMYPNKNLSKALRKRKTDELARLGLIEYMDISGADGRLTDKGIKYVENNILQ